MIWRYMYNKNDCGREKPKAYQAYAYDICYSN